MTDFKAKMHQIRFQTPLRSLQRFPKLDLGAASRQGEGLGWGKGREGDGGGSGGEGKGLPPSYC